MRFQDAERRLAQFLAPMPLEQFLDGTLRGAWRRLPGGDPASRVGLLGADPAAVLARAHHLAPHLTFHSADPAGPAPGFAGIAGPSDFKARIEAFHALRYSVRFPNLRHLSPELDLLARSFEAILHKAVTASAFWSRGDLRAPVHFDDHDIVVIQLRGRKRWYLGDAPAGLENFWDQIPGPAPALGEHSVVDLAPGDVMFVPRGTVHTVDAAEESLHLALGFIPVTLRELVVAAVDELSDQDRALRATVGHRMGHYLAGYCDQPFAEAAARAIAVVGRAVASPGFMAHALRRRSARALGAMEPLPVAPTPALTPDTILMHAPGAWCHLSASETLIDVAYPGGHLYIHRGAEAAVTYIVNTPRFRIGDIAGAVDDDVRLSLAARFCGAGFLVAA